ncbi:M23 family metallopeptidase [Luteibacter sp.]|jgi:murein DD-endopeptidase MepM/ murein hydrolase activator NlpD|uniref:M23 family metallopeptidase n=1 Tax=Luteibacter sp. TaxID=1886636 RepID=UPI002F3F0570
MRKFACALGALTVSASAVAATATLPASVSQGALVIGHTSPGVGVTVTGKPVHVGDDGVFVFGVSRDEKGPIDVTLGRDRRSVAVTPRDWPVERVDGVPPKTVNPPPAIAARIAREQAEVVAARDRDDSREDFARGFAWPVTGRISGRFGNQRIYNGDPKAPHSGMDIAVPEGTPVKAPADGVITFAKPGLYLTGGTLLLDHGFGLSSNFLHLSRIDVKVGQHVRQGQVLGAAGKTGRATGPHLHWGFNWFGVRLDPLLLPGIR